MSERFQLDGSIKAGDEAWFRAPGTEMLVKVVETRGTAVGVFRKLCIQRITRAADSYKTMCVGETFERAIPLNALNNAPWGLYPI